MSRRVVNLDELRRRRAQSAEAKKEPVELTVGDDTFEMPSVGEWPIDFMDTMTSEGPGAALALLLGDEQWQRLRAHRLTNDDLNDLMDAIGEETGVNPPQSAGSPNSSKATPKTSKRISSVSSE